MRRLFLAVLAALLLVSFVAPATGAAKVSAASAVPKVVVIVGPSGSATDRYRAEATRAAALARRYTPDVTELYSPNATWPAVRAALQGASLVIYMGHGNGWPSRYRDSLYPPTQNGFGLNPGAGTGDYTHQYFGEGPIARSVRLAKDAVVLLNHLCYASGNTEPGLPEGSLAQARQRVDNFAAGFIKAGASAVIAEAYSSPDYMVRSILGSQRSIQAAWKGAPSRNNHAFAFESARSPGYIAQMDPERGSSGFSRSIVLKSGLVSSDVLRGARGNAHALPTGSISAATLAPSLMAAGITATEPTLESTTAATTITYHVPYKVTDRGALPKSFMASVRWDPLDVAAAAPSTDAASADGTAATADPTTPPDLGLVTAERIGDVVAPVKVKLTKKSFAFSVATPKEPGRYRLTVTLHDKDGVAYDGMTQALLPSLIVRVTGDLDAQIVAPTALDLAPGAVSSLPLWVANLGVKAWGQQPSFDPAARNGTDRSATAKVVGQWVVLGDLSDGKQIASAAAASATPTDLPSAVAPGAVVPADLKVFAPAVAGDYLLILDIVSPDDGSLTAKGVLPTTIRVHVAEPLKGAVSAGESPVPSTVPDGTAAPDASAATTATPSASTTATPSTSTASSTVSQETTAKPSVSGRTSRPTN